MIVFSRRERDGQEGRRAGGRQPRHSLQSADSTRLPKGKVRALLREREGEIVRRC